MVSLTEKPCRFTLAGLFSFSGGGSLMNTMTLLGIDIGKHSFHLHGQDTQGHQVLRKKMSRGQLLRSLASRYLVEKVSLASGKAGIGGVGLSSTGRRGQGITVGIYNAKLLIHIG
jgi:hypothetical protein